MSGNNRNEGSPEKPKVPRKRLTGYVRPKVETYWKEEMARVAGLEGWTDLSMGMLFAKAERYHLRFDDESLRRYAKTHNRPKDSPEEPEEQPAEKGEDLLPPTAGLWKTLN